MTNKKKFFDILKKSAQPLKGPKGVKPRGDKNTGKKTRRNKTVDASGKRGGKSR